MNQNELVQIFESTGITYKPGKRQTQRNQVRFFGFGTAHSFNLGFSARECIFVADFVFKSSNREVNKQYCEMFSTLFGGEIRIKKTAFVRIYIPFSEATRLTRLINAYWSVILIS